MNTDIATYGGLNGNAPTPQTHMFEAWSIGSGTITCDLISPSLASVPQTSSAAYISRCRSLSFLSSIMSSCKHHASHLMKMDQTCDTKPAPMTCFPFKSYHLKAKETLIKTVSQRGDTESLCHKKIFNSEGKWGRPWKWLL